MAFPNKFPLDHDFDAPRLTRWQRFLQMLRDIRQAWRDLSDPFDVEV